MQPIPGSYTVGKAVYKCQTGTLKGRPVFQAEDGTLMVRSASTNNLIALEENKESEAVDISKAKKGEAIKLEETESKSKLKPKGTSACGHCWTAVSSGGRALGGFGGRALREIGRIGLTGALWAPTIAFGTMAYAQRTIVRFVPAVINTTVNGTVTTILNTFNATAVNATCVNDTTVPADRHCVYEQREFSLPHAAATIGLFIASVILTKQLFKR